MTNQVLKNNRSAEPVEARLYGQRFALGRPSTGSGLTVWNEAAVSS
jgi:hypothetical protein